MDIIMKPTSPKKRKIKSRIVLNIKSKKMEMDLPTISNIPEKAAPPKKHATSPKKLATSPKMQFTKEEILDVGMRYPILKDEQLVQRFLKVPLTNNQKGRIRQAIKASLQGTNNALVPDIIQSKIQSILRISDNLTDSQLRRVRILYNLLTTSLKGQKVVDEAPKPQLLPFKGPLSLQTKPPQILETIAEKPKRKIENKGITGKDKTPKDPKVKKVKGPKRYVVFLGNLPLDVDKDKISAHFSEMNEHIKNIRIPKARQGNKASIAFLELSNEASYEFALSKHHSMLGRKRINVLYTAQKNGTISAAEAKSKSAKLIALQKTGKLVGSTPLVKKRSQRRLKQKLAQKTESQ